MSGVNKSVPLDDAITEAKWMLGISETTIHDIWLNTQAERILINMSNLNSTAIYNTTLDVVEGEATLPDGMVRLLALRYCDSDGKSYGAYIGDFNFINKSNCSCDNNSDYPFTEYNTVLMINDSKLLWHSPSDAPSKVRIAYRGRRLHCVIQANTPNFSNGERCTKPNTIELYLWMQQTISGITFTRWLKPQFLKSLHYKSICQHLSTQYLLKFKDHLHQS
jgi:hypothetical protein